MADSNINEYDFIKIIPYDNYYLDVKSKLLFGKDNNEIIGFLNDENQIILFDNKFDDNLLKNIVNNQHIILNYISSNFIKVIPYDNYYLDVNSKILFEKDNKNEMIGFLNDENQIILFTI